jgi:hypothetical protein
MFFVIGVECGIIDGLQSIKNCSLIETKDLYPIGNIINFCYVKYKQNHLLLVDLETERYIGLAISEFLYDFIHIVTLKNPS